MQVREEPTHVSKPVPLKACFLQLGMDLSGGFDILWTPPTKHCELFCSFHIQNPTAFQTLKACTSACKLEIIGLWTLIACHLNCRITTQLKKFRDQKCSVVTRTGIPNRAASASKAGETREREAILTIEIRKLIWLTLLPAMNNGGTRTCKTGMVSEQLGGETLARWQQEDFHQGKKQPCSVQVSGAIHQHMCKKCYWGHRNILILFPLSFWSWRKWE